MSTAYNKMMADYDEMKAKIYARNQHFVKHGGHFMPLDQTNRIKLQLARMIGIAPELPAGVEVPLEIL